MITLLKFHWKIMSWCLGSIVLVVLGFFVVNTWHMPESARVRFAREEQEIQDIFFYGTAKQVVFVSGASVAVLSILILSYGLSRAKVVRASVFTAKLGEHYEVPVARSQLPELSPIMTGLVAAESLRAHADGQEQAFAMYCQMADVQQRQIQAILGRKGIALPSPSHEATPSCSLPALPAAASTVPTFAELLRSQVITPGGGQMILGYAEGQPMWGTFLDIYSAAVAGESGSGKTATLLYLIACGLVSLGCRFYGIDPHYPHPKSLGAKTKPLWKAGLMTMATYKDDMLAVLQHIEDIIDARLSQQDLDTTPVVLVIDELAFLNKTSIGKPMAHTMERISTEGRKCEVYMLASSQTWLVARTGSSSVVRDTLTAAFVHRIKPKQANLLLQDKEEASKVKSGCKQPGDVLLCPVNEESTLVKMPLAEAQDMQHVVTLLQGNGAPITIHPKTSTPLGSATQTQELEALVSAEKPGKPSETSGGTVITFPLADTEMLLTKLREAYGQAEGKNAFAEQMGQALGVSASQIKNLVSGNKPVSSSMARKLTKYYHQDAEKPAEE